MFEKVFKLKEHNTNVKTEVTAGLTTFVTMAYILAVNPNILSEAGMDRNAVMMATAIASGLATLCMAFMANLPFALSAGMGLNAYFTYTVVLGMGNTWQFALLAVFVEGIIFIILSLTNVREAIFNAIPLNLKRAVSVGIGLFIAFIGLQGAGICVDNGATLVSVTNFTANFHSKGIAALLAIIGLIVITVLHIKKVKGSVLIGILSTWILGMICQATGLYVPNVELGMFSLYPDIKAPDFASLGNTFGQCFNVDFANFEWVNFIVVVCAFLFVDVFDTLGTLMGVASQSKMLDKEGRLPGIKPALLADAVGTTAGAVMGTSTVTTFVESASGVGEGGRTGLTALVVAVLFLLSTLLAPIFTAIPAFATAPALIFVGFLMFSAIGDIKFDDLLEAVPAYLCILAMPLFYSISEGIAWGIVSYVILHLLCGKGKKVTPLMYILAVLFVLKYIFL